MRMPLFALVFAASAMMPFAALGADGLGAPATTATLSNQASDLDEVICKKLAPPTGTRLGGRTVCDTKRHWQQLQQESKEELTRMQFKGGSAPAGGAN